MVRGSLRSLITVIAVAAASATFAVRPAGATDLRYHAPPTGDITGTVTDSASGTPIEGVSVTILKGTSVIALVTTDPFGRYRLHSIASGAYTLTTRMLGFKQAGKQITVGDGRTAQADFKLTVVTAQLQAITIEDRAPVAVDTRTGDQTYTQNDAHYTPTQTTSQVVQQSVAGAARAPTGEVHIRGQHAEYTYYVDGVPVTSGVAGSLNELFDPAVVQRIDFQTGGWDAEYGEKNTAIINIQTRVPTGAFHLDESTYYGSYNAMGQSLNVSTNQGKFAAFFSGTAEGTDMRRDPVVGDAQNVPENFNNHGEDYFGFMKLQYLATDRDIFTFDANYSTSHFQIPFDSSLAILNDHESDVNAFFNLAYRHRIGVADNAERGIPNEFFLAAFYRNGGLQYRPGAVDQPSYIDQNDSTQTPRNVFEDRQFNTVGLKTDLGFPIVEGTMDGKIGALAAYTYGHEDFQLIDPNGVQPNIGSNSGLNGYDLAAYAETSLRPSEWFELRTGVRYNSHVAPFASNQTQLSPRIRMNFFLDASNTIFAYFGRTFMPTNIEDLRSITLASGSGSVSASPTLPERDSFWELAWIHRFLGGVTFKLDGYWKDATPGIDDNTIPGSAITTDVNQSNSHIRGIEIALHVNPPSSPLSGYVNFAINHNYANGPVTGGFFQLNQPNTTFDADHDQRISAVANLVYSFRHGYISATGIYGTGLTAAVTPDANVPNDTGSKANGTYQPGNTRYCTGLFCFNSAFKVPPSYIQQFAIGYTLLAGATTVRPEFFVDNAFNVRYVLKGAFYSGQSIGRPRTFNLKIKVGV
jgi:hypothetical protein